MGDVAVHYLDTLELTSYKPENKGIQEGVSPDKLQKRARSKYVTRAVVKRLVEVEDSPLNKNYWDTWHCSNVVYQEGKRLKASYCNNRWCIVCNRIRTANLINGYLPQLSKLQDPYFVTLTIPNMKAVDLEDTIKKMYVEIKKIQTLFRNRRSMKLTGIRKMECTYNDLRNDFHPHYHFIIDGKKVALTLINEWLNRFPGSKIEAQDMKQAGEGTVLELFKYFTKLLSKDRTVNGKALDTIFRAMRGKRVFQSMGLKKEVPEDIEGIRTEIYEGIDEVNERFWRWDQSANDWIDPETGETLTRYKPSENIRKLVDRITGGLPGG